MIGYFDAQCPRCQRKFAWKGGASAQPACPRCGFRPPQAEIDADAKQVEAFRDFLRVLKSRPAGPSKPPPGEEPGAGG